MSRLLKDPGQNHFGLWTLDFGLKAKYRSTACPVESKIQNPKTNIREESGAALIISVAIFAVLLFIALTFWSASRIEHQAALRHQQGFQGDMLANAGQALAVSHLRLDKQWHPAYTSLDHGWNTFFNGAWLAGKPWAFNADPYTGGLILERTWNSYVAGDVYKRIPYIDYWSDVEFQEAELERAIQYALFGPDPQESLGSALAQIKNPLFVPRFQFSGNNYDTASLVSLLDIESQDLVHALTNPGGGAEFAELSSPFDFPVQYAYDFTNYDPRFDDPNDILAAYHNGTFNDIEPAPDWPARRVTSQQKINFWADVDNDGDGLKDSMWIPIGVEVFRGGIDRDGDGRVGADEGGDGIDNDLDAYWIGNDGVDNDGDGSADEADEQRYYNLDEPDETAVFVYWGGNDGLDNDQDGLIDAADADEQRAFLTAPIIADSYWGGNDGEDNDHDGTPDEGDEQRIYLTNEDRINNNAVAPRVASNLSAIPAGEGIDYQDPGECIPLLDAFDVAVDLTTLNEFIASTANPITIATEDDNRLHFPNPGDPFDSTVDRIDNDFTQIVNDTHGHAFIEPSVPQFVNGSINPPWDDTTVVAAAQQNRARSYSKINIDQYALNPGLVFPFSSIPNDFTPVATCAGEVVCVVAGRVAVHIVDEASKMNLNTAGAMVAINPQDETSSDRENTFVYLQNLVPGFAHNQGISGGEVDTRVLPDIGVQRALATAVTRTGEHRTQDGEGIPLDFPPVPPLDNSDFLNHRDGVSSDDDVPPVADNDEEAGYTYDTYFAGYGLTDDNANALQLQNDGIDNDGDGAYYVYDFVDNDRDGLGADLNGNNRLDPDEIDPDEARFGIDEPFEGIDEPQELQLFRPLRNRIAELDGRDNDNDGSVDEIGEIGDKLYNTGDEMEAALASVAEMQPLRAVLTVQSNDPNARYQHYLSDARGELARNIPPDTAPITGMKLDYNYATADAIVNALEEDWSYKSTDEILRNEIAYHLENNSTVDGVRTLAAVESGNPYSITSSISIEAANLSTAPYNNLRQDAYYDQVRFEAAFYAGLRRESTSLINSPIGIVDTRYQVPVNPLRVLNDPTLGPPSRMLEADAGLRAYQLALNVVDSRDADRIRNTASYRQGDEWWSGLFRRVGPPVLDSDDTPPVLRQITYDTAGTEGIRINEIMVRAVRRVETESNYVDPDGVVEYPENNPNVFGAGTERDFDMSYSTIEDLFIGDAVPVSGEDLWGIYPDTAHVGLGDKSGWDTTLEEVEDDGNTGPVTPYQNVMQFRIGPSAQLPPGRYYLMVNTIGEDGRPTVEASDDIEFTVKYARESGNDILDDVLAYGNDPVSFLDPLNMVNLNSDPNTSDPIVSRINNGPGTQLGWVFLPTVQTAYDAADLPAGYEGYFGIPNEPALQNTAYTVIVPPYATAEANQYYLYIGVRKGATSERLAVNFFDFSQEPDHEWIEIVNVSESPDPIDLSGWILEVGGGATDGSTRRYTIPGNRFNPDDPDKTYIAPNGSLLLVTDKYDDLQGQVPNGLAAASDAADGICEPAIPRYYAPGDPGFDRLTMGTMDGITPWNGRWGVPFGTNASSVFQNPTAIDFIDRDGDGSTDGATIEDTVLSTRFNESSAAANKPWDRIVQLRPSGQRAIALNDVAELVLSGGIFPNYPDDDTFDNDGDAGALLRDGIDNDGDRPILDHDLNDNDSDGLVDEGSDGIDNNNNGLVDEVWESENYDSRLDRSLPAADENGNGVANEGDNGVDDNGNGLIDEYPAEYEGVEENIDPRLDYDGIDNANNSFDANGVNRDRSTDGVDNDCDGFIDALDLDGENAIDEGADNCDNDGDGFVDEYDESEGWGIPEGVDEGAIQRFLQYDPLVAPFASVPGSFSRFPVRFVYDTVDDAANTIEPYWIKGYGFSPEWKEFAERRMYPGDAVRVTLYQYYPEEPYVVDRVTYTQNDVENRSPDDMRYATNAIAGVVPDEYLSRFRMLNGLTGYGNERAWPENTMGVDFYRSLERKHPLYAGDRFGVANRWTATDGNYDDWAPGTNRWYLAVGETTPANFTDASMTLAAWDRPNPLTDIQGDLFFAHGFSGSPLRANFFQRLLEDSRIAEFRDSSALAGDTARVVADPLVADNQAILARARVRDGNFRSPGDLLTVPHLTLTRTYTTFVGDNLLGREGLQGPTVAPEDLLSVPVPPIVKGASIGTDFPKDLRALIETASFDSVVLNVGQADFYPLFPTMGTITGANPQRALVEWEEVAEDQYRAPVAWAPVFLASLDPAAVTSSPEREAADFAGLQTITIQTNGSANNPAPPQYPNLFAWPGYPVQLAFLYQNADLNQVTPYANTTWLIRDDVAPNGSHAASRWPLERRAMMYVSTNPPANEPIAEAPQALFVWDGADGLANGEYDVYVVTMPDTANLYTSTTQIARNTNRLSDEQIYDRYWLARKLQNVRRRLPIEIGVLTDKDGDRKCWVDNGAPSNFTTGMPDSAQNSNEIGLNTQGPGNQRDFEQLPRAFTPTSDGTVHVGRIKVENNFLGLYVRNIAGNGIEDVNAITRVVLMTRDRTPGRLNINTAITQPIAENANRNPQPNQFNPLTGLAGFTADFIAPTVTNNIATLTSTPWRAGDREDIDTDPPYLADPVNATLPFNIFDPDQDTDGIDYESDFWYQRTLRRTQQLLAQPTLPALGGTDKRVVNMPYTLSLGERFVDYNNDGLPDNPDSLTDLFWRTNELRNIGSNPPAPDTLMRYDGRYMLTPAEILVSGDESAFTSRSFVLMPSIFPNYAVDVDLATADPFTALEKAQKFDELKERYARMGNSVTTVSDTFEIYVTAQTGYVYDANNDGVVNWRDDKEFVITGEKKLRTVYER